MTTNINSLSDSQVKGLVATEGAKKWFSDFCVAVDAKYDINWHHKIVADKLQEVYERVLRGESPRVMLFEPPRHGKSDQATKKFPAWVLGKSPEFPFAVASYSADLATDFGQGTRDIMDSSNYQAFFKTRLREDTQAKAKWMTEEDGGYTAVGRGGAITGRGFKIGIFDDPFKDDEEAESEVIRDKVYNYYTTTFYTRQEGNAAIIVILTRWHDDDLAGRLLKDQGESEKAGIEHYDKWEVIDFKAIAEEDEKYRKAGEPLWPAKFPLEALERTRRQLGPYKWSALYQQQPVDVQSQEFKKDWFKYRTWEEIFKLKTRRFCTIDPALKASNSSDYCGITINFVDLDNNWNFKSFRKRLRSDELINELFELKKDFDIEEFGIEQGQYKIAIEPFLEKEMRARNIFLVVKELTHNETLKETRIRSLIPRYSSGSTYHIVGECFDLEAELMKFPKAKNDDTMDSAAYQSQLAQAPVKDSDEKFELYTSNFA